MTDKPLSNICFVLTGKLSTVRAEATAAIERLGGYVDTRITYRTDYLVAGTKTGAVKMNAARSHGVQVIDEDTLLKMIGN
jgi:DNA ligase (NAD+)